VRVRLDKDRQQGSREVVRREGVRAPRHARRHARRPRARAKSTEHVPRAHARDGSHVMTMTVTASLLVAVVGALLYFATQGKPSQAGLVAFGCGLLALLFALGGRVVHFGGA